MDSTGFSGPHLRVPSVEEDTGPPPSSSYSGSAQPVHGLRHQDGSSGGNETADEMCVGCKDEVSHEPRPEVGCSVSHSLELKMEVRC